MAHLPAVAAVLRIFGGILAVSAVVGASGTFNYREGGLDWGGFCNTGTRQTPIDIVTSSVGIALLPRTFDLNYQTCNTYTVINKGDTIQIKPGEGCTNTLVLSSGTYDLLQAHAHVSSEHLINGVQWPLEFHFVHRHRTDPSKLAVIGVLYKLGATNNSFIAKWLRSEIPVGQNATYSDPTNLWEGMFNGWILGLLQQTNYFNYLGSLTTPTCDEIVEWFVLKPAAHTPSISVEQLITFQDSIQSAGFERTNNRWPKPRNGRGVTEYSAIVG